MKRQLKTSNTVIKAFEILDFLESKGESGASIQEVTTLLGSSKSTAHRYLITFEKLSVVERDQQDRFRLGVKLIELAGSYLSENNLQNVAQHYLEEIVKKAGETAHLATPFQHEVVYIDKFDSPHSVRMSSRIGMRAPMYCTALGKAMLAFFPPEKKSNILNLDRIAHTANTIISSKAILSELEHIREIGYAVDDQENEIGVRCVGAPIFDYQTRVIGAISLSGPANRLTLDRSRDFGPFVKEVAIKISNRLGYPTSK